MLSIECTLLRVSTPYLCFYGAGVFLVVRADSMPGIEILSAGVLSRVFIRVWLTKERHAHA